MTGKDATIDAACEAIGNWFGHTVLSSRSGNSLLGPYCALAEPVGCRARTLPDQPVAPQERKKSLRTLVGSEKSFFRFCLGKYFSLRFFYFFSPEFIYFTNFDRAMSKRDFLTSPYYALAELVGCHAKTLDLQNHDFQEM